jgi:hypothetical protein
MKLDRKRSLPVEPAEGFTLGKNVAVDQVAHRVAVTPDGGAKAYFGVIERAHNDQTRIVELPLGSRIDPEQRGSFNFVELRAGGLYRSSFLSDEQHYDIREDLFLRFPFKQNSSYGVFNATTEELEPDLTRQLFGATQEELERLLLSFFCASHFPIKEEEQRIFCRTTCSRTANACDLGRFLIPPGFPYITFGDGHISLQGFYRHLAFLCEHRSMNLNRPASSFFKVLVEHGGEIEVIKRLKEAAFTYGGCPLYYGENN